METKYLVLLGVILVACLGVFLYQFNNDVPTYIVVNGAEVSENSSFSGMLVDAYGYGVANKTITYHKPGQEMGSPATTTTDEKGQFTIDHAEYLPNASKDNYYGDFNFAGDGKYQGCSYDYNITVVP